MGRSHPLLTGLSAALTLSTLIPKASCSPTPPLQLRSDPSACRIPSIPSVYLSIGHGFGAPDLTCVPSTGTMHTSTIFVDFPDQHAGNDTTSSLYSFFFPAASEWYSTSSFGKLSLDAKADTSRFYRMPKNASAYEWNRGITSEQHQSYIQDALDSYSSFNGVDLAPADALYVIASRNSPAITYSPTFMGTVTTRNGTFVANKAVTVGYDAYKTWGYKLINHETGHVMCLADLYPASGAVGMYVGDYDVMGNINAVYPDYFAWDKWRLGWLEDAQVACLADGVGGGNASVSSYVVGPVERAGEETKAVVVKKNETQAMVVEVRAGAGVDDKGGKPGVVVYTVDTTVETLQGPIRVLTEEPLGVQSELEVPSWGVKVLVGEQEGEAYAVTIETGVSNATKTAAFRGPARQRSVPLSSH